MVPVARRFARPPSSLISPVSSRVHC